jgi:hypothetical protein
MLASQYLGGRPYIFIQQKRLPSFWVRHSYCFSIFFPYSELMFSWQTMDAGVRMWAINSGIIAAS